MPNPAASRIPAAFSDAMHNTGADAQQAEATNQHSDDDAISVKTMTDDLFSQGSRDSSVSPGPRQRRPGLHIYKGHGWSGSEYDDYE